MNVKRKITMSVSLPVSLELTVEANIDTENPTQEDLEAADWSIVGYRESSLSTVTSIGQIEEAMTEEDHEELAKAASTAPPIDDDATPRLRRKK